MCLRHGRSILLYNTVAVLRTFTDFKLLKRRNNGIYYTTSYNILLNDNSYRAIRGTHYRAVLYYYTCPLHFTWTDNNVL